MFPVFLTRLRVEINATAVRDNENNIFILFQYYW